MNKTKLAFLTFMLFGFFSVNAQDAQDGNKDWKNSATFNLNFNNTNLSTYWNGGGQSAMSINGLIGLKADYNKGKHVWNNSADLGLGYTRLGKKSKNDSIKNPFTKTDDRIILISNYGYKFKEDGRWSAAAGLDFRTQFVEGLDANRQKISDLFAPAYLIATLGFKYTSEDGNLKATISPIGAKITFVTDDSLSNAGAFGVDMGSTSRSQLGANLAASYSKNFTDDISLKTNLNLFADYETIDLVDVNWDATLTMKVNKYITASLALLYIYDHDIKFNIVDEDTGVPTGGTGPRSQFSNVINIGFVYNLKNYKE